MIGFTTVSEPIPVSWTISSTKLRADPPLGVTFETESSLPRRA